MAGLINKLGNEARIVVATAMLGWGAYNTIAAHCEYFGDQKHTFAQLRNDLGTIFSSSKKMSQDTKDYLKYGCRDGPISIIGGAALGILALRKKE